MSKAFIDRPRFSIGVGISVLGEYITWEAGLDTLAWEPAGDWWWLA